MNRGGRPPRPGLLGPAENSAAAEEVRRLRRALGISQARLAGLLHESAAWVSVRETGARPFSRTELLKVSAVLRGQVTR